MAKISHWEFHPAVSKTGSDRTIGEKAADGMRHGLGTWTFLLGFTSCMAIWLITGGFGVDPSPFFRLNLILSMLAGLQGSVLLIAAKRSDRIAAELASYHLEVSEYTREVLDQLVHAKFELDLIQKELHIISEHDNVKPEEH